MRLALEHATEIHERDPDALVVIRATPGPWVDRGVLTHLQRLGHGSVLTLSHRQADDLQERPGAPGRRIDSLPRKVEELLPEARLEQIRPWLERGWSLRMLLDEDEIPSVVEGEGPIALATLGHLRGLVLMPMAEARGHAAADDGEGAEGAVLAAPFIYLGRVGLVEGLEVDLEALAALVEDLPAPLPPEAAAFLEDRRELLDVLVAAISPITDNYLSHRGKFGLRLVEADLIEVLEDAAGGREQLLEALRRTVSTARFAWDSGVEADWAIFLPAFRRAWEGDEPWRGLGWRWLAERPATPAPEAVKAGAVKPHRYPRRDLDDLLVGVASEVCDGQWATAVVQREPVPGRPERRRASIRVMGPKREPRMVLEVRQPAGLALRPRGYGDPGQGLIAIDPTAGMVESEIRAAWPDRRVEFLHVEVEPAHSQSTIRVHLRTGRSAYRMRTLFAYNRRGDLIPTELEHDGAPVHLLRDAADGALARLVDRATRFAWKGLQRPLRLGIVCSRALRPHLEIAAGPTQAESDGADEAIELALKVGVEKSAQRLLDLAARKFLADLVVEHHVACRGSTRLAECDAVLALPHVPNLGAIREDYRVMGLGVQAEGWEEVQRLGEREVFAALECLPSAAATPGHPVIHMVVGDVPPNFWAGTEVVTEVFNNPLKPGGPPRSPAAHDAREVALELLQRHGVVGRQLISWLGTDDGWSAYEKAFGEDPFVRLFARSATEASRPTLNRAITKGIKEAKAIVQNVRLSAPDGSGTWTLREVAEGKAKELLSSLGRASHNPYWSSEPAHNSIEKKKMEL